MTRQDPISQVLETVVITQQVSTLQAPGATGGGLEEGRQEDIPQQRLFNDNDNDDDEENELAGQIGGNHMGDHVFQGLDEADMGQEDDE